MAQNLSNILEPKFRGVGRIFRCGWGWGWGGGHWPTGAKRFNQRRGIVFQATRMAISGRTGKSAIIWALLNKDEFLSGWRDGRAPRDAERPRDE